MRNLQETLYAKIKFEHAQAQPYGPQAIRVSCLPEAVLSQVIPERPPVDPCRG
ncbi:unnamed protein product [Acanthoscelides obtectus]|uniref:Uncharacterized protein n=1 Tax=Acanthoscelides obtectus TaxID=200917 RepID=A0A9P0LNA5_ACAOB|nr:unnamed protein product [Acanthoscelides obtectus]CAK1663865.1 hypothetical protein AOBTE_LOCUS23906 [Acanthoscelides obtectus]